MVKVIKIRNRDGEKKEKVSYSHVLVFEKGFFFPFFPLHFASLILVQENVNKHSGNSDAGVQPC